MFIDRIWKYAFKVTEERNLIYRKQMLLYLNPDMKFHMHTYTGEKAKIYHVCCLLFSKKHFLWNVWFSTSKESKIFKMHMQTDTAIFMWTQLLIVFIKFCESRLEKGDMTIIFTDVLLKHTHVNAHTENNPYLYCVDKHIQEDLKYHMKSLATSCNCEMCMDQHFHGI